MAKVSASQATPGQVSDLRQQAILQQPVDQVQEAVPQATPEGESKFDALMKGSVGQAAATLTPEEAAIATDIAADDETRQVIQDVQAQTQAGAEAAIDVAAQQERERVASLSERAQQPLNETQKWDPRTINANNAKPSTDGGLKRRAQTMAALFSQGDKLGITPASAASRAILTGRASVIPGQTQGEAVAAYEAEVQGGSLIAAMNRSGAVQSSQDPETRSWTNKVDPLFLQVGSAVTENMLSEAAFGDTDQDLQDYVIDPNNPAPTVDKAKNNMALGRAIHRDYMRMKNAQEGKPTDEYVDLPAAEATTLGDAFKEMWSIANPTLVTRADAGQGDKKKIVFQLTPEGVEQFKKGATDRKRLFPKKNVKPLKAPVAAGPQGQLPGEQGRVDTKKSTGKVKQPLAGARVLQEAAKNMAEIPNVVDKQREKILYATVLPVLAAQSVEEVLQDPVLSTFAEINNIGEGKWASFSAAQAAQARRRLEGDQAALGEPDYDAVSEMRQLQSKIAQEVRSISQERDGANYLTYTIQAFNGRMSPQQSYFDPTTSKAVRFVTRNAVPAPAAPGSRVAKNLEQMYAMMLVKGADSLLPDGRTAAFNEAAGKLEAWGDRLTEVLENSMTDAQADAIAEAISNGVALTDPNFPQFAPLQLDPAQDAELIQAIKSKGEDGPHFIDGLMDASKYIKARRDGRTHNSYFNAYIDGKTNGIASNGIQMGSEQVARATGVIRNNTRQLLDAGDIRDQLKADLLERLETQGFDGTMQDEAPALYQVARVLYGTRNLNKATTMTFSYGKELASFMQDVEEFMDLNYETAKATMQDPSADPADKAEAEALVQAMQDLDSNPKWGREKTVETLHKFYVGSLASVLSNEAIQSRGIMRSAAMMHAITDQLFSIKSATGFELNMGGEATLGFDEETATTYTMERDGRRSKVTSGNYKTYSTASAIRRQTDEEGNVSLTPGEDAYGGSVPGPVQSLDAATVALSASGRSWKKLKDASNGNPYMHTIYDAFKLDAMGFDVMNTEINKNWLDASMDWSYLEETRDATQQSMSQWAQEFRNAEGGMGRNIDISMEGEGRMVGWLLTPQETASGRSFPTRLSNKLRNLVGGENEAQQENIAKEATQRILNAMSEAGVQWQGFGQEGVPMVMSARQYMIFVNAMAKELDLRRRLDNMIEKTNNGKKRLRKVIDAQKKLHGNEVLQYYAH